MTNPKDVDLLVEEINNWLKLNQLPTAVRGTLHACRDALASRDATIADLERRLAEARDALDDAASGLRYVRRHYGNLYGNYIFDSPRQNPYIQRRK